MPRKELLFVAGAVALVYFLAGAKAPGVPQPTGPITTDASVWKDPLTNAALFDTSQTTSPVDSVAPRVGVWMNLKYQYVTQAQYLALKAKGKIK